MNVRVSNGKYTFVKRDVRTLEIDVLRHGKPWVTLAPIAFNALHSIMCELDAARVVIASARRLGDAAPSLIRDALRRHSTCVDDREAPTAWAGEPPIETMPPPIDWQQRALEAEEALALATGPSCSGCGHAIDPDCCWCGTPADAHRGEEHGFVPMGCDCCRDPGDRDWKRSADDLRRLLWQAKRELVELKAKLVGTAVAA